MDAARLIEALDRFGRLLPAAVGGVDPDDMRWRPPGGGWSILEIVHHLLDEEVEDFRARLDSTLHDPGRPWPGIDPEGAAAERRYNDQNPESILGRFVEERTASVEWLRHLLNPDWEKTYEHPKIGPLRAGDLLVSWTAHDALHLRQIAKRLFQLAQRDGKGYDTSYAGGWTA